MQLHNHIHAFILLLITTISAGAQPAVREIEFNVYGQYPVRNIEYRPIGESSIQLGEEPPAPVAIKTHSLARMGPYTYKGIEPIEFYNAKNQELVAKVTIPPDSDKWLLIFLKNPRYKSDPNGQLRYLVYPFNDSPSHLPADGLIFLNISGNALDGLLEDKRVSLGVGESGTYRVQESLPINLWARSFDGEKLLPALVKTYSFTPNHRYLMIFFPPVLTGSVDLDVRFLSESAE
ncbi:hypothetical protein QEH52_06820 [Coraliomargarita sp. SDUM461003]|uniref:Uncharacterized protein n=1 Tax=Thalassobacterium maritimum TaxID=3041265 RepID=A0ABU1AT41_9BACT|nr:hypothetical protein [Coraliomargarita sp. SDUM461003]MDQ8207213.1 hypothetical protein [Coraliomargarita sp. SDUM461003]